MPLPAWMKGHPGAPQPTRPDWLAGHLDRSTDDDTVAITACSCRGEGCTRCNGDGVIYP